MVTEEALDNRLFERFAARYPAKFKDARDEYGSVLNLRNASAFGLRISSTQKLYTNDTISIEVSLPDGQSPMTLKGEVVWAKEEDSSFWDIGIKLHKLDLVHMSRLYKFVAPQLPDEY